MPVKNRILIIDDEADITEPLCEQLTLDGYEVITAGTGNEAIKLVNEQEFEVVVLDLVLPEVDGIEILQLIKKTKPSTKVIVLTGYPSTEYISECRKQGADDFIEKPTDLGDIFNSIEFLLKK